MRGVSEVIAIILILMITISLAGLAYMFMSTTMSDVTSSAGSTVDTTTSSMMTSFTIESMDIAKVYVRNTGQNAITSLSVYINDEPATFNVTTPIAAGSVGTITIYSFIPDGATVKVTSPNGFSTSKVAQPCSKAVGCWKFDEGTGTTAYDSSPYGNTGTLTNGPTWASGKYGNGIQFDGSNDYIEVVNASSLNITANSISIEAWIKSASPQVFLPVVCKGTIFGASTDSYYLRLGGAVPDFGVYTSSLVQLNSGSLLNNSAWHHVIGVYNSTHMSVYVDERFVSRIAQTGNINPVLISLKIGGWPTQGHYFNGTIDEVRIYNRAIY